MNDIKIYLIYILYQKKIKKKKIIKKKKKKKKNIYIYIYTNR